MTTDQAVNRQADHENLIRELAKLLREAYDDRDVRYVMGDVWAVEARQTLEKVDA